jgi:AraC family transcriptional regulator, melibiose operon regulatory protein
MLSFDHSRRDFASYGFTCVRWTPTVMPRSDRHNEVELNLLEEGSLTYLLSGQKMTIPAGRLAVFWGGIPHQIIEFESQAEYFVMTIPLVWFLQWRLPRHLTQPVLHGHVVIEPDECRLAADCAQFRTWMEDIGTHSEERYRISLLEIEARLRRLALTVAPDAPDQPRKQAAAVLGQGRLSRAEQMACFIAQHYTETLTAETISQHVGLHPNYAMDVFQRTFGTSMLKYVTQYRLSHAQRLLITTDDLILSIALNSGFGSLSRFNEAFRQAFACTPRDYRKQHRLE